jgi:hypothetical protein
MMFIAIFARQPGAARRALQCVRTGLSEGPFPMTTSTEIGCCQIARLLGAEIVAPFDYSISILRAGAF